jgi:hypothetical protein
MGIPPLDPNETAQSTRDSLGWIVGCGAHPLGRAAIGEHDVTRAPVLRNALMFLLGGGERNDVGGQ